MRCHIQSFIALRSCYINVVYVCRNEQQFITHIYMVYWIRKDIWILFNNHLCLQIHPHTSMIVHMSICRVCDLNFFARVTKTVGFCMNYNKKNSHLSISVFFIEIEYHKHLLRKASFFVVQETQFFLYLRVYNMCCLTDWLIDGQLENFFVLITPGDACSGYQRAVRNGGGKPL